MRKLTLVPVLAVLLMAASATDASATRWSGACDMTGTIALGRPYHMWIENNDYEILAGGTCTGTLDGAPYDGPARMYIDGRMNKPMACTGGISNNVPGYLYFGSGSPNDVGAKLLDVYMDEFHVILDLPFHLAGAYNGQAAGELSFVGHVDQQTLEDCLGSGMKSIDFDLKSQTLSELYG
jgi:hypothetical protein